MKKVFISSVIQNFELFRNAAKSAVELMELKPIMAEELSSRTYSSETACISEVQKSDLVLVILGKKYGFRTPAGISVTQSEYRAAIKAKKAVLVFLEDGELEPDQAAFKAEVENYYDGFFRTKFSTSEQLKHLIIKALRNWEKESINVDPEGFEKRLNLLLPNIENSRNEARAILVFWCQPTFDLDLDEVEQNSDKYFTQICSTGAASVRDGYNLKSKSDHVVIKTGKTECTWYSDGLTLLNFSAEPKEDYHSFSFYYVSPTIFTNVATKARTLNSSKIVWVCIGLYGMESRYFEELTKGNSTSVPMFNQTSERSAKLFSPITDAAYTEWIETQTKKFKRTFSKK